MRRRRGFVLVVAMLVAAALFFFTLMYVQLYRAEQNIALQGERVMVAREAASAGLYLAAIQLKVTAGWTAGFIGQSLPASGATVSVTFSSSSGLPYSTNNYQGTTTVTGWGGRVVPPGGVHLVSIGQYGPSSQIDQALIVPPSHPYTFALFGLNNGTLGTGSTADVFDSSVGPYPTSLITNTSAIGTNSTATGKIVLNSGSVVHGTVRVGPKGGSNVIKGTGTYDGVYIPSTSWPSPPMSPSVKAGGTDATVSGSMTLAPGGYRNLTVSAGSTLTLQAGTYVFNRITVGDNVTIIPGTGPVTVWFGAALALGKNNQINAGGSAGSLNFVGIATSSGKVAIDTGTTGAFTFYAPWSDVTVGDNSELYCSLIGKTFTTGANVKLHLDLQLQGSGTSISVSPWW